MGKLTKEAREELRKDATNGKTSPNLTSSFMCGRILTVLDALDASEAEVANLKERLREAYEDIEEEAKYYGDFWGVECSYCSPSQRADTWDEITHDSDCLAGKVRQWLTENRENNE